METVLIIDSDPAFVEMICSTWANAFTVLYAKGMKEAVETLRKRRVSGVLAEFGIVSQGGTGFLQVVREEIDPRIPIIILGDGSNVDFAMELIRKGATDFIFKDISPPVLKEKVKRLILYQEFEKQLDVYRADSAEAQGQFVFADDATKRIHFEIARLADRNVDILLAGETGVGKDLIAFEIHRRSARAHQPFITLPIRSFSETLIESEIFGHEKGAYSGAESMKVGKLEAANHGTLYIPEVCSLTESTQLKLLHFLQYRNIARVGQDARKAAIPVDVRIVFATNKDASEEVAKGNLRADFFYRINVAKIHIPPLRERPDDIEPLANYFVSKHAPPISTSQYEFERGVLETLRKYRWPGNVRELENCIREMIAQSTDGVLRLPVTLTGTNIKTQSQRCEICLGANYDKLPELAVAEKQFKQAYFNTLLRQTRGNISAAASKAGMTPQGLRKAIRTLKLPIGSRGKSKPLADS